MYFYRFISSLGSLLCKICGLRSDRVHQCQILEIRVQILKIRVQDQQFKTGIWLNFSPDFIARFKDICCLSLFLYIVQLLCTNIATN